MGLLDEARAAQEAKAPRVRGCNISRLLVELDAKVAADLQAALDDTDIDAKTLSRVLQARGHNVSQTTIQTHRRGDCCRG